MSIRSELKRKSIHIVVALALAAAPLFISREYLLVVCAVLIVVFSLAQYSAHIFRWFELDRPLAGAAYLPIGIGLTAWYFLPEHLFAYLFGALVLALADTAAALIGKRFGINPIHIGLNKRTLEGSLAFFVITMVLLALLPIDISITTMIVISVLLTHIELFTPGQFDNIVLPVTGALLFLLLV